MSDKMTKRQLSFPLIAVLGWVALVGFESPASAQGAPPPPPPPGGEAAPPPPTTTTAPPVTRAPAHSHPHPHAHAPDRCRTPVAPPPAASPRSRCHTAAPAPAHKPYYAYPQRYRPRHRRYHRRVRIYVGMGGGAIGFLGAKGPYRDIKPGAMASGYVGLHLSPRFSLELGVMAASVQEKDGGLGGVEDMFMWGVTLDVRFNLIPNRIRNRFLPYIQAGIGAYGLHGKRLVYSGQYFDEYESGPIARGGGFQAGMGMDIYLTRWFTLGAKLIYRGIIFGDANCGGFASSCDGWSSSSSTIVHTVTGELNLTFVF